MKSSAGCRRDQVKTLRERAACRLVVVALCHHVVGVVGALQDLHGLDRLWLSLSRELGLLRDETPQGRHDDDPGCLHLAHGHRGYLHVWGDGLPALDRASGLGHDVLTDLLTARVFTMEAGMGVSMMESSCGWKHTRAKHHSQLTRLAKRLERRGGGIIHYIDM